MEYFGLGEDSHLNFGSVTTRLCSCHCRFLTSPNGRLCLGGVLKALLILWHDFQRQAGTYVKLCESVARDSYNTIDGFHSGSVGRLEGFL